MRLALSDVEPRLQKLLKRNGNKCLIKLLLFFCKLFSWVTAVLANRVFIRLWVAEKNGSRNTALAKYTLV